MIIGFSGKKQSGKSLAAKITQLLLDGWNKESVKTIVTAGSIRINTEHKYQIKMFADKLKDLICLLFGCTREQLEDEEFKSSKMPKCWECWIHRLDIKSNPIIKVFDTREDALNHVAARLCGIKVEKWLPTYREVLQYVGTDLFRDKFNSNVWVNATMADYKVRKLDMRKDPSNWIMSDVRFKNEAEAVKKHGILIRINRRDRSESEYDNHESETDLDNYCFKYIINNDDSIEALINKIYFILKENRLL